MKKYLLPLGVALVIGVGIGVGAYAYLGRGEEAVVSQARGTAPARTADGSPVAFPRDTGESEDRAVGGGDVVADTESAQESGKTCTQGDQVFVPGGDDSGWDSIKLYSMTSSDGKTFGSEKEFATGAGVPSVTRGADGTLVAVFQSFTTDDPSTYNKVLRKTSVDNGATWSEPEMLCVSGLPKIQSPYDPTIVATADGKYRLFFTTHELGMGKQFYYASAISDDGLNFTYEGTAFKSPNGEDTVDGAEVRLGDAWLMVAPLAKQNGAALDAVSTDGKTFTLSSSNRSSKLYWVGNLVDIDGTAWFYGSMPGGLGYSTTKDGKTWTEPALTNLKFGGDVAATTTEDGKVLIIYAEPKKI